MRGTAFTWLEFGILLIVLAALFAPHRLRLIYQKWNGVRGRDWPAVSAVIDIVSVVLLERGRGELPAYQATLTYFYRYPDLQTGEYSRLFEQQSDAQAWAAPYKGRTVRVRVDPRDPSRSVLLKEDLG